MHPARLSAAELYSRAALQILGHNLQKPSAYQQTLTGFIVQLPQHCLSMSGTLSHSLAWNSISKATSLKPCQAVHSAPRIYPFNSLLCFAGHRHDSTPAVLARQGAAWQAQQAPGHPDHAAADALQHAQCTMRYRSHYQRTGRPHAQVLQKL